MKKINWIALLCVAFATMFLNACGDSVEADGQAVAEVDESSSSKAKASSSSVKSSSSKANSSSSSAKSSSSSSAKSSSSEAFYPESFKPNDAEYPYAGIPRIVIETEKRQEIKDRETEIPAKLQIWGEDKAESEILDLTIRGRGNSSWDVMPKKSYKIEFENKQLMLGMPKDKDWALIANYADKTLMRNYLAYQFAAAIGSYYAPKCEFADLYLNGEYLGVYLVTETIKIGSNRVNLPNDGYSYIVEFDAKYKIGEQVIFSKALMSDSTSKKPFRVHDPKNASDAILDTIQNHIYDFEIFLKNIKTDDDNKVNEWIDVEQSVKHYWIQEVFKNPDACFYTSVYFSWVKGGTINMGPVWDFDLAMGNHSSNSANSVDSWQIRNYWNNYLLRDKVYQNEIKKIWNGNLGLFESIRDTIDVLYAKLKNPAVNNFNRWNVLADDSSMAEWKTKKYGSYKESVNSIKDWISKRIQWIDSQENL